MTSICSKNIQERSQDLQKTATLSSTLLLLFVRTDKIKRCTFPENGLKRCFSDLKRCYCWWGDEWCTKEIRAKYVNVLDSKDLCTLYWACLVYWNKILSKCAKSKNNRKKKKKKKEKYLNPKQLHICSRSGAKSQTPPPSPERSETLTLRVVKLKVITLTSGSGMRLLLRSVSRAQHTTK